MSAAPESISRDAVVLGEAIAEMGPRNRGIADEINACHRLARSEYARHAIRAGELLLQQKARCRHGEFQRWIEDHCDFAYSTAARYMGAATAKLSGVEISKLSGLFPSGRTKAAALAAPAIAQTTEPEHVTTHPASAARCDEPSIELAIATLEADGSADSRRRLARLRGAAQKLKKARRSLQCAEVAQRNAQVQAIALARKLREAHE